MSRIHARAAAVAALAICAAAALPALAGAAETEYEWSMDLDCTLCHQREAASLGQVEADAAEESALSEEEAARVAEVSGYAEMHATSFKMDCATCHVESEGLGKGHKKLNSGKEATRLKKSEVTSEPCLACHQVEKLAEATADYQGLTDANGTTVNPHDLPAVESHEAISCTDCHQVHSGKTIDKTAVTTCNSCHHAGVFECGTCH